MFTYLQYIDILLSNYVVSFVHCITKLVLVKCQLIELFGSVKLWTTLYYTQTHTHKRKHKGKAKVNHLVRNNWIKSMSLNDPEMCEFTKQTQVYCKMQFRWLPLSGAVVQPTAQWSASNGRQVHYLLPAQKNKLGSSRGLPNRETLKGISVKQVIHPKTKTLGEKRKESPLCKTSLLKQ